MVVKCEECQNWRVFYAARVLKREQNVQLEHNLDVLSYSCGASFCDIEDKENYFFDVVYINDKLTCDSPIEASYYVVFINDPLCFYCGSEHNHVKSNKDQYPPCNECKELGEVPRAKNARSFKKK